MEANRFPGWLMASVLGVVVLEGLHYVYAEQAAMLVKILGTLPLPELYLT